MLGTVLLIVGGVTFAVLRMARNEERKHGQLPRPDSKKSWTRFALPGFAVIYIGICAWVSADDWRTPASASIPSVADAPSLTDDSYRAATLINHALVLDFGASWCVSCKKTAPEFSRIAASNNGKYRCFTMDVDKSPATAKFLQVELLPCIMLIVDGKVLARRTGPASEQEIQDWIDIHIPKE